MKTLFKLCLLLPLYWLQSLHVTAQYSEWSIEPARKSLKARYMKFRATDGYNWIKLQITSTKDCTMEITSTLCNADPKDKNGWKRIFLRNKAIVTVSFKILNSCINGWWWWYRGYRPGIIDEG